MEPVGDVRRARRAGAPARGVRAALVAASGVLALTLAGCGTVLTGIPSASPSGAVAETVDTADLSALLVGPEDFPAGYTAQVLEYRDALLASADLSGVSAEARINPVRCQPPATPAGESDLAMASGMREDDQSTVAVILTRMAEPISAAKDVIGRCLDVVSDQFGVQSRITRAMAAPPSAGTPGEFAYTQTVSSGSGEISLAQESTTLVAQVGDVRISVVGMSQQGAEVDRAALDQLLAAAVANLR